MYRLSDVLEDDQPLIRDAEFKQTDFASSVMPKSLCFAAALKYLRSANDNPNISAIVTTPELADAVDADKGVVADEKPEQLFYSLHNRLANEGMGPEIAFGVDSTAQIHPSAVISPKAYVGPGVTVSAGAVIEDHVHLDEGCWIGPNAVVGASGHFYKRFEGRLVRIEHAGGVWLSRGVQVLSGAIVSKSLHPNFTKVGEESVVSVQAHVGHGCEVGSRTILAGNVQLSGYTIVGDDVWIGPGSVISNLIKIGDGAQIQIGSVVVSDVASKAAVSGNFAESHRKRILEHARRVKS